MGNGHAGCLGSPTDPTEQHRCHSGCFYQKHETRRSPTDQREVISPMRTDRSFHGFFTLAPRPTARVLMRRRRDGWARILSQTGREMHLCKSERSVGDN